MAIKEVHAIPARQQSERYTKPSDREIIQQSTVYFQFDLYEPTKTEMAKIELLSETLINDLSLRVEIDGHTDIQGSSEYNFGLSQARADFIRKYFIQKGIGSERITIVSFGEKRLEKSCDENCTSAIHKLNRRAEIILYR